MGEQVDFSIVTPSLNMLSYLKRCHASIIDQKGVTFEHIVMDAVSTDGTPEWLSTNADIVSVIQKDAGMYDAVNQGWRLAKGQILSYLNCDEQYLPDTLKIVSDFFRKHPDVDIIFGDALLINPDGTLLSYRKGYQPRWMYIAVSHLYVLTCTMFIRRHIVDEGFLFDTTYRIIGDSEFVVRLLRAGYKAAHINRFLSVFTMTGSNLSYDKSVSQENDRFRKLLPWWLKAFKYPLNIMRLLEKAVSGAYWQKMPISYEIYTSNYLEHRTHFDVSEVLHRWKWPV